MKAKLVLAAALASLMAGGAYAQSYPDRPVTIIVPAAAGGPSDTVARLVAQAMGEDLGQQVVVENMGGAGGSLGTGQGARAAPDGYTLVLYHVGVATFNALYPDLPYDALEDLDSVGLISEVPLALVSGPTLEMENIGELLEALRSDGESYTLGTAGIGAVSDLCGMLLADALDTEFTVIPYQGTGPALTDLLGGQIDLMCDQTTNTANQIGSGELKAYAVTTRERIDILPDLPTVAESGVDGFEVTAWHALWTPAGTPPEIRERLSEALQTALEDPTLIERFNLLGTTPVPAELATPGALDDHFSAEVARWQELLAAVERN